MICKHRNNDGTCAHSPWRKCQSEGCPIYAIMEEVLRHELSLRADALEDLIIFRTRHAAVLSLEQRKKIEEIVSDMKKEGNEISEMLNERP